ncbi:MAG: hypothetical protein K6G17_01535, partial [Oscillospiraceae bacterium]|nr:hypothetical protein [Oscillospiraceae bacterium]
SNHKSTERGHWPSSHRSRPHWAACSSRRVASRYPGELLLFPAALRGAAIEGLAAVCERLLASADGDGLDASFEALFSALRFAEGADWEELLEAADPSGAILALDPSGDYPRMDRGTRQAYLERLELLSRAEGCPEQDLARRLIDRAAAEGRHVGFLLFEGEKPGDERPYIAAVLALTVFLSLMLGRAAGRILAAPLLLLPVSELVKGVMDAALLRAIPPRRLPRMDVSGGVGAEGKTLCVVTALLTSPESAEALCRRLEEFRCANRGAGENLLFGVLADLPAADSAEAETDEAVLRAARQAVTALNRRCGGGFFLFTRPRRFDGERWSGHERKRGALLELARLLADEPTELRVAGDRDALAGTRFLLTLDSDTQMSPGAAAELIGAMLHPLNRPELDENGVVRKGFGLIHPRLATELSSASATDFALIFAGPGGSDPYGSLVNELYSSAFDSGGFAGKGILDAETLLRSAAARLPEGRVLSHDALEGAILRGGFLGDVEFTDAFPARPLAWYRRLHRWVRGDWQNAPWVFRRGAGLRPIERWRLFDSLRRSLAAPLTLAAILAGFFLPAPSLRLSAWTALLALLSRLIASLAEAGRRPAGQPRLRRATRLLGGVGGALVQSFIRLWLLPFEAWICLTAALSSLWRMAVTKRRLLEWETAAQSDRRSGGLGEALRAMAVPAALGLACLLFASSVIARAAGLLWLLSPAALTALGLPARSEEPLSRAERAYLLERAGETWRYFTENLSPQTHFLPPDNVQSRPPIGAAERCSPTNLGLAAAAAAAACDLSLAKPEEALAYLRRLIGAMEALPRCLGHFYNWYDTRTLRPLRPPMISTVDSGNCYASLLTAAAFCREQGDEALAARIGALLEPMDFAPLYDRSRGLFWISFDPARGCGVGGHYDLLASEAMLTSYLAVAKGDAPVKHWRRLGRGQLQKDGFRGLASWTGTVFEYLMPFLFLPLEHGSLLYESARFCLYAQRRAAAPGQPWGASESAYFSLDGALNYRYKAHGCPALALKRGMGADRVAAPYASFLALAVSPRAAVRNLRRFERLGMLGPWGYYDALDCTPGRCRSERGEVVACTMAHHAGMSLLAAANALCGGSVRRRFMGEAFAASCRLLLQEKLDDGTPAPQRKEAAPERAPLPEPGRWRRRGGPEDEGLCLLSNGVYHLLADGRGGSRAALGEERLVYDGSPLLLLDGEPLLPGRTESWDFGEDGASWRVESETLSLRAELFAAASELGEGRELRLTAKRAGRFRLALVLRPVLALRRDWESHASFWRLGLWAEERGDALLLRRLARGSCPEHWLCVAGDRPLRFEADERGGLGWLARPLVRA